MKRLSVRLDNERHRRWSLTLSDGTRFFLTFQFSVITELWHMTIENSAGAIQVAGIAMVLGVDLLKPYHHLDVPSGRLFLYDTSQAHEEAGVDGFDSRVLLVYDP